MDKLYNKDIEENIEEIETCTYCGNPIYIHRESYRKDLGNTTFHNDCYGKYISLIYGRYQEAM